MRIITRRTITKRRANFLVIEIFGLIIRQANQRNCRAKPDKFYGLTPADPVECGRTARLLREKLMKKLLLVILLAASPVISSPAWAQTKLLPKSTAARADNCAPIGRTEDGKLVYSMKCATLPSPPSPPPQAEVAPPLAPEPDVQRSGIFGWSYERKRPDQ
jgi:hypothetical protein